MPHAPIHHSIPTPSSIPLRGMGVALLRGLAELIALARSRWALRFRQGR
jgi:hypothetical protein